MRMNILRQEAGANARAFATTVARERALLITFSTNMSLQVTTLSKTSTWLALKSAWMTTARHSTSKRTSRPSQCRLERSGGS